MASLADPPVFRLIHRAGPRLDLEAPCGARAHVFVLEPDIIRLLVLPRGELEGPPSWAVAPGAADVPWGGRDRFEVSGFSCPAFQLQTGEEGLVVATARLRLELSWRNLRARWSMDAPGQGWLPIAEDRPTQAYDFGWWDGKPRHYLRRRAGEAYFGLGERAGPLDRAGRRYRLSNVDAMGYDAETSDPLYKHIPFYLTRVRPTGESFGLFYDAAADATFDFGCERSNYHGLYRGFEAESGDLDYYLIAGPEPLEVVRRFTWLTGRPARLPRWSMAYSGSGMAYADDPEPLARLEAFAGACAAHDIPCQSLHLSSGYTLKDGRRNVFVWDRGRCGAPGELAERLEARGLRVIANIKPCLLTTHPDFPAAAEAGLLVRGPDGAPSLVQFWDGLGAYLDFTHPDAVAWWRERVTTTLLKEGIAGLWNDNNEFEIRHPLARLADGTPALAAKPRLSMLMMRASREAQLAAAPTLRPMSVSRSGAAGMQRYVQTWSGDNATDWKTPRWNSRMGLGLALSGVSNFGHDVGGFSGPRPNPELLARWSAAVALLPRYSIHSWNDDGSVTEPWSDPGALAAIRAHLALRHRLGPYLDEALRRYSESFEPVVRALFLDAPDDPAAWDESDPFRIGPDLLVAPALDPGMEEVALTAPRGDAWRDLATGRLFAGGETLSLCAPWSRVPVLVRAGAILPLDLSPAGFDVRPLERGALICAPRSGPLAGAWVEDDGVSLEGGARIAWRLTGEATADAILLTLEAAGAASASETLRLVQWEADPRPIRVRGAKIVSRSAQNGEIWTQVRPSGV
jgi:alpha-glucosidase